MTGPWSAALRHAYRIDGASRMAKMLIESGISRKQVVETTWRNWPELSADDIESAVKKAENALERRAAADS